MTEARAIFTTMALMALSIGSAHCADPTPEAALLSVAKRDGMLSIIDPESLETVARIAVGEDPHEIVVSENGRTAYVSNYGFGRYHTISVVDLVAQEPLKTIDLAPLSGPHGLAFVGGKLWFTAEIDKLIGRFDPGSDAIDRLLGVGQNRTHMIFVEPGEARIITTNVNSGTVSIIEHGPQADLASAPPPPQPDQPGAPLPKWRPPGEAWLETVVPAGKGAEGFDVAPDGHQAWIANAEDGTITVVDVKGKIVLRTLELGLESANRLKFTPDGKHALVSMITGEEVAVLDTVSGTVEKRLRVGQSPSGILMQPDGARAYVACSRDDTVAVIDLNSMSVTGHIPVGSGPDGLAWADRR